MNIASAHLSAVQALGYTEAEARFLYIVATHSGYFVARQFLAFTNAHWGYRTNAFWIRLHTKGHARTECFPKSGTVCAAQIRDISTAGGRGRNRPSLPPARQCGFVTDADLIFRNQAKPDSSANASSISIADGRSDE
jgi:hypothetical protein